jgi:hypothetical protein
MIVDLRTKTSANVLEWVFLTGTLCLSWIAHHPPANDD